MGHSGPLQDEEGMQDFPGGPVIKTLPFHCMGHGFHPWSGTKIPHAEWCAAPPLPKKRMLSLRGCLGGARKYCSLWLSSYFCRWGGLVAA